jgi:hypothetical protein
MKKGSRFSKHSHYVDWDQPAGPRGLARAICGVSVYPEDQSMTPSCPACQRTLLKDEQALAALQEDDVAADPRRI